MGFGGGGGGGGTAAIAFGTAAARPAPSAANTNTGYYATDTGELTLSNGAAWNTIQQTSSALKVGGAINAIGAPLQLGDSNFAGALTTNNGSIQVAGAIAAGHGHPGNGLQVGEGTNGKQGVATLVAGTVTVANTTVSATSRIFSHSNADGGTPGWLRNSGRTAGTSFTVTSSSNVDTSTVAYQIFEAG